MILIINFNSKGKSYIELLTGVVQHHFFTLLDYWLTRHGVDSMICARSVSSLSCESTSLFFFCVCVDWLKQVLLDFQCQTVKIFFTKLEVRIQNTFLHDTRVALLGTRVS